MPLDDTDEQDDAAKFPSSDSGYFVSSRYSDLIRVDSKKIDKLINMLGELVTTQSMLSLLSDKFEIDKLGQLQNGLSQMKRHTRELQESVLNIRMLPISLIFSRFPRLVHDLSLKYGKKVKLSLTGEHTEVDKIVIELLSKPLVNLLQYCIEHNLETPNERISAGKTEIGAVSLNAFHLGIDLVIEISDDGRGFDKNILRHKAIELGIIEDGMPLTDKQTFELLGMPSNVKANRPVAHGDCEKDLQGIQRSIEMLDGSIGINSQLGGLTTFVIRLPLIMSVLDGQSVAVANEKYIVPVVSIVECISLEARYDHTAIKETGYFHFCGERIPVVSLHDVFNIKPASATNSTESFIVVVEERGIRFGLLIDELLEHRQVVVKAIDANHRNIEGLSAATIFTDGSVGLILDIPGICRLSGKDKIQFV